MLDSAQTVTQPEGSNDDTHVTTPSKAIRHFETTLELDGLHIRVDLITMRRSFLLAVNNADTPRGFRDCNTSLNGLSLSIGGLSTCLINANTSESSTTLALRLSKKFNNNNPVYVSNNVMPGRDIDMESFTSKLYMKVFQIVGNVLSKERLAQHAEEKVNDMNS